MCVCACGPRKQRTFYKICTCNNMRTTCIEYVTSKKKKNCIEYDAFYNES